MNRQQRRAMSRGKMTPLERAAIIRGAEAWGRDTAAQMAAQDYAERIGYLFLLATADELGIGPVRYQRIEDAMRKRCDWYREVKREEGEEAAYERMRRAVAHVCGKDIDVLFTSEFAKENGL